jgi:hypothetical protein
MPPFDFSVINGLLQWVVAPALVWIWSHERRLASGEREILKLLTILEERNKQRDNDKIAEAEVLRDLRDQIKRLADKLDRLDERAK